MSESYFGIQGLTDEEVQDAKSKYGRNVITYQKENHILSIIKGVLMEPMVLLLLVTASLYYFTGNVGDAIFLGGAIVFISAISFYQDYRSRMALEELKLLGQPNCNVLRDGRPREIKIEEVVIGDCVIIEEGSIIPADGFIMHSNDFSVNESILTGESLSIFKDKSSSNNQVYRGTMVVSGLAIVKVDAIGASTEWGKISNSIASIKEEKTPLELQINSFVKNMVIVGAIFFAVVWVINYYHSREIIDSLLKALTLAMSILPEEIPVAFTTFMALGAWRLMKEGVIVKQMKTVETLGGATVICVDKTGTITKNEMSLKQIFALQTGIICNASGLLDINEKELIAAAMWASEPIPFDPMEIALHDAYANFDGDDRRSEYSMIHEYPLGGLPPMMTHVFENGSHHRIIAAKGAPEAILAVSTLSRDERLQVDHALSRLANAGYRILGVAMADYSGDDFPEIQQDLSFRFLGLVAFYDPPKQDVGRVLEGFYNAGIQVKLITGDNAETTRAIADEIRFNGAGKMISGDRVMNLPAGDLPFVTSQKNIFTRMHPMAKLKVVNAIKSTGEIVGMVGDGINDAPSLKAAHIGIAMGKKGTEIAKEAATLILAEDDLSKMLDAIAMGRKIYANLKKAIQYIISIHIPIILTVFIPLVLGWMYPSILSPVHVILLELIMGPTCSILYENEPMESNTMSVPPRSFSETFFQGKELIVSIVQGLAITIGVLFMYQYAVSLGANEYATRAMVFTTLISANIFLTLLNRSFYHPIWVTIRYKNNLVPWMIGLTIVILAAILFIHPLTAFFEFERLPSDQIGLSVLVGFVSVIWYEIVKWRQRRQTLSKP